MAVIHLQSVESRIVSSVDGAVRVVKTADYRQPQASLSLPTHPRHRIMRPRIMRVCMPNRMPGHERLDFEAASAARTGRSGGHAGGLPHRQGSWHTPRGVMTRGVTSRTPRVCTTLAKRSSRSFDGRNLPKPCAWGCRFDG
jgi:hypothetical protein